MVGECTKLLYNRFIFVAVLVRADMNRLAPKYRIAAAAVFGKQTVKEGNNSRVVEIEMVYAVLLRAE